MKIDIDNLKDKTLVTISGKIDTTLATEMHQIFEEKIADGSKVEIDAKKLEYITSAALRSFLILYKRLHASGGSLSFTTVQPTVMQVFQLTGFDTFITIE